MRSGSIVFPGPTLSLVDCSSRLGPAGNCIVPNSVWSLPVKVAGEISAAFEKAGFVVCAKLLAILC